MKRAFALFAAIVGVVISSYAAQAREVRVVPVAGATLTYRQTYNLLGPKGAKQGSIYAYSIKSSDGLTSNGVIKVVALLMPRADLSELYPLPPGQSWQQFPGARTEDGFLALPVPDKIGAAVAKFSKLTLRYFIEEQHEFPLPAPANEDNIRAGFSSTPVAFPLTTTDCDLASLQTFPPFGSWRKVQMPCFVSETSNSGHANAPPTNVVWSISYEGESKVTVPSGAWKVEKISLSTTSSAGATTTHEVLFSTKIGAIVSETTVIRWPQRSDTRTYYTELIEYRDRGPEAHGNSNAGPCASETASVICNSSTPISGLWHLVQSGQNCAADAFGFDGDNLTVQSAGISKTVHVTYANKGYASNVTLPDGTVIAFTVGNDLLVTADEDGTGLCRYKPD